MVKHPIYTQLLKDLPNDIFVNRVVQGSKWTCVQAGEYCGLSLTDNSGRMEAYESPLHLSIKDIAQWVLSWDFRRASIGLAAINAYYSNPAQIAKNFQHTGEIEEDLLEELKTFEAPSKISSIGGFPFLRSLTDQRVQIFEMNPKADDLPPQAIEFELQDSQILLITGSTMINKTLPRILEISERIPSIILGPSTCMHPSLFVGGVKRICGLQVLDAQEIFALVGSGASSEVIRSSAARKIEFSRRDIA